jgi:hypothetical protein
VCAHVHALYSIYIMYAICIHTEKLHFYDKNDKGNRIKIQFLHKGHLRIAFIMTVKSWSFEFMLQKIVILYYYKQIENTALTGLKFYQILQYIRSQHLQFLQQLPFAVFLLVSFINLTSIVSQNVS